MVKHHQIVGDDVETSLKRMQLKLVEAKYFHDIGHGSLQAKLTSVYGEYTHRAIMNFDQMRNKQQMLLVRLVFSKRCRDSGLIPVCTKLPTKNRTTSVHRVLNRANVGLLKALIRDT